MHLFHVIDDASAIIRLPKGVHKQTKVYRRERKLYVPHGGGYVRLSARSGDEWLTSHPDVKVLEMDVSFERGRHGEPLYKD